MEKNQENNSHLTSKETQKALKIRACDLMHLREAGMLRYGKKGNAYLYLKEDVLSIKDSPTEGNFHKSIE